MNYLAHAHLSFHDQGLLFGNMVADSVRGRQACIYPENVRRGIRMHYLIDQFTDADTTNKAVKQVFAQSAGRYCGAFLDVAYDHFLAVNPIFTPIQGWERFAAEAYTAIEGYKEIFPEKFANLFGYMSRENWFCSYRDTAFIHKTFERLSHRATYLDNDNNAFDDFLKNYACIGEAFLDFYPRLQAHVSDVFLPETFSKIK